MEAFRFDFARGKILPVVFGLFPDWGNYDEQAFELATDAMAVYVVLPMVLPKVQRDELQHWTGLFDSICNQRAGRMSKTRADSFLKVVDELKEYLSTQKDALDGVLDQIQKTSTKLNLHGKLEEVESWCEKKYELQCRQLSEMDRPTYPHEEPSDPSFPERLVEAVENRVRAVLVLCNYYAETKLKRKIGSIVVKVGVTCSGTRGISSRFKDYRGNFPETFIGGIVLHAFPEDVAKDSQLETHFDVNGVMLAHLFERTVARLVSGPSENPEQGLVHPLARLRAEVHADPPGGGRMGKGTGIVYLALFKVNLLSPEFYYDPSLAVIS